MPKWMPGRHNSRAAPVGIAVALGLVAAVGLLGCGEAATRSTSRFCGELEHHATEIQTTPTKPEEVPALITLFSKMGEVAPLEVQHDWEAVYGVLKTASTMTPGDAASQQAVADASYAVYQSAVNVVDWAKNNCAIDIGPIAVVPGGVEPEVTTTTLAG